MNCLENGRNPAECVLVTDARKRREAMKNRFHDLNRQFLIFGLVLGFLFGIILCRGIWESAAKAQPEAPTPTVQASAPYVMPVPMPEAESTVIVTAIQPVEIIEPEPEPEPAMISLGTYRITAYCSCEKCCGEWAKNRPGGIVKGAAGVELKAGVSCAAPLPFGTVLIIDGIGEYVVQDRTSTEYAEKNGGKVIDIYFDNHEAALDFGVKYLEVFEKEGVTNDQVQ